MQSLKKPSQEFSDGDLTFGPADGAYRDAR